MRDIRNTKTQHMVRGFQTCLLDRIYLPEFQNSAPIINNTKCIQWSDLADVGNVKIWPSEKNYCILDIIPSVFYWVYTDLAKVNEEEKEEGGWFEGGYFIIEEMIDIDI